tara:strand:- start:332 stop:802 length:471 start_codon:yes stop_codon:yes gene_type:complete
MILKDSTKEFLLEFSSIKELKNFDFISIGLKPLKKENIYLYKSKGYKFLNYKITPNIYFLIIFQESNCIIELKNIEISEISSLLKLINIVIKVNISQQQNNLKTTRYMSLEIIEKKSFLKFMPDDVISKLLNKSLATIAKRFDAKFIQKMIPTKVN